MAGFRSSILAVLVLAAAILGCDRSPSAKPAEQEPGTNPPPPAVVEHPATITGRVIFVGAPPQLPRLAMAGDPHCQQVHPDGLPDESVVVAGDGATANVIVYLKDAPPSDGSRQTPALLDQVNCQYVPHVVALQIRQTLRIKSSDSVFHNVHVLAIDNAAKNLSEVGPGEQTLRFGKPEIMHVRCDVHPWMKAIIGVFDNPYFAVTGADGKFEIRNVRAGTYTLAAWHERFGEQTKKITVSADGTATADFQYAK